jgi:glycine cleavage system H protein
LVKVDDYEIVEGLYYSKDYMWMRVEEGKVRIGVTDFVQQTLGEIGYVEFEGARKVINQLMRARPFGAFESAKGVFDLIAPVSGPVQQTNEQARSNPELINKDPYGEGWILIVSPTNLEKELTELMNFDEAVKWYKRETPEKFKAW